MGEKGIEQGVGTGQVPALGPHASALAGAARVPDIFDGVPKPMGSEAPPPPPEEEGPSTTEKVGEILVDSVDPLGVHKLFT